MRAEAENTVARIEKSLDLLEQIFPPTLLYCTMEVAVLATELRHFQERLMMKEEAVLVLFLF